MYVFQSMLNKLWQSESGLGDCLVLMHVFLVIVFYTLFPVRVPNRVEPRLKVQVMYVVWIGLVTRLTNTEMVVKSRDSNICGT